MFRWYRDAAYCFVYLSDISKAGFGLEMSEAYRLGWGKIDTVQPKVNEDVFRGSRWFKRGWTLQELLAPGFSRDVRFYTSDAHYLGNRDQLSPLITAATGIPEHALAGGSLGGYSISERLKWAENRHTKREEDGAYSLLGIFDVHMPLLYGEGRQNAMFRLLQECQANERRTLGVFRAVFKRYLSSPMFVFVHLWGLLFLSNFLAVLFAVVVQGNDPIVAPYARSKITAIGQTQIARFICIVGTSVLGACMNLVARMLRSLEVALFDSLTIMLVLSVTFLICVGMFYALAKVANTLRLPRWTRSENHSEKKQGVHRKSA